MSITIESISDFVREATYRNCSLSFAKKIKRQADEMKEDDVRHNRRVETDEDYISIAWETVTGRA